MNVDEKSNCSGGADKWSTEHISYIRFKYHSAFTISVMYYKRFSTAESESNQTTAENQFFTLYYKLFVS